MNKDECKHEPDMGSVTITRGRDEVFVDVVCRKCGHGGCFGRFSKQDEVDW